jgi:glycosyltransferase involved in cell wall biosynthesis
MEDQIKEIKISALIIAKNEEKNIEDCLKSVSWCDEIILVDSKSTDRTVEIAKKYTGKIIVHDWQGYAFARELSLQNALGNWIISLDADERVSPELKNEIQQLLNQENLKNGYLIPRRNYFLDKVIKTCFWYPDYQMRLFKRESASVSQREVHEGFIVKGEHGELKNDSIHFTHQDLYSTFEKINKYSSLEITEFVNAKPVRKRDLIIHPVAAFLNHFISRKGYKDGMHGMMVSIIHAMTNMMRYMKLWEKQNVTKKE